MTSPPPPPPPPGPVPPSDRPVAPPAPPSYHAPVPATWGQTKPPAPACPIGAWLMIGGGVVMVIGCIVPWFSLVDGTFTVNAFTDFGVEDESSDAFLLVLALAVLGFGITTLLAKRLLPIAILAVVLASFALIAAITRLSDVAELSDLFDVAWGAGLPILLVGSAAGLAGGIIALATRRR